MNESAIRAALVGLDAALERARDARRQIEADHLGEHVEGPLFEDPKAALGAILEAAFETTAVVLDAAGLVSTRSHFMNKWKKFTGTDGGLAAARYDHEFNYLEVGAFEYLVSIVDNLRLVTGEPQSAHDSFELAKLEGILRSTAVLVRRRLNQPPGGEMDVQKVMHDYLAAFFPEYVHPVKVHGVIKNFEPDGESGISGRRSNSSLQPPRPRWRRALGAFSRTPAATRAQLTGPDSIPSFIRRKLSSPRNEYRRTWVALAWPGGRGSWLREPGAESEGSNRVPGPLSGDVSSSVVREDRRHRRRG